MLKSRNGFDDVANLTKLTWGISRKTSGTAGTFLKAYDLENEKKVYYKMSNYDSVRGVYGHECVNEIVAGNVANILGMPYLPYELIKCKVTVQENTFTTWVTKSNDFKCDGETSVTFETWYELKHADGETVKEFIGNSEVLSDYFSDLFLFDYLIYNRDRHGANIEILQSNGRFRLAPVFDNGVSFLFSCHDNEAMLAFDLLKDGPVNNYVGSIFLSENLGDVNRKTIERLFLADFAYEKIFAGLEDIDGAVPSAYFGCIQKMIEVRVDHAKEILSKK